MIYGSVNDALRYRGIHPGLDLALENLCPEFIGSLGEEKVLIQGDDVYAFKVNLKTLPEAETFYESHHGHIDIHVVTEGAERMDIDTPDKLELYEEQPENDAFFYHGGAGQPIILTPGKFLIAFPEDAHRTCGIVESSGDFVKVVYKIKI